ncbi:4Fe-4S binding protein [Ruminococcaceae bacterium OttesenSCG-928-D13]|nr:4Fe-4S binding protein [Ruminococcaceae bacterium OttesenSCG-928-D13]
METVTAAALQRAAADYLDSQPGNFVGPDLAFHPGLVGLRMYDAPLVGVAAADDPIFEAIRAPEAVGPHHCGPGWWLPEAASVVSFFFPLSPEVRASNRLDFSWPSDEWLHARIDGHQMLDALMDTLAEGLREAGCGTLVPGLDPRYKSGRLPSVADPAVTIPFTSNWSERHVAHACGLGTFGLSRGLITEKGMAGRFGSLITTARLAPTPRPYTRYDEYCTRCGACVSHCPVAAISLEGGKKHAPCAAFLDKVEAKNPPYYGCGKCQVAVPCETGIPKREVGPA